jgi:hypothetical protein
VTELRRDPWRAVRKTVAQSVLVFTAVFVVALVRAVLGSGRAAEIHRSAAAWTVWCVGIAFMVAGSVFAVLMLRTKEPRTTSRSAAWWCGGLWAAGFVLALVYSSMVKPPVP